MPRATCRVSATQASGAARQTREQDQFRKQANWFGTGCIFVSLTTIRIVAQRRLAYLAAIRFEDVQQRRSLEDDGRLHSRRCSRLGIASIGGARLHGGRSWARHAATAASQR